MTLKSTCLNQEQQALVLSHLPLVHKVIYDNIHVSRNTYGYEYDDLFQEGCIWLCYAALSYNAAKASFGTYAKTVVRNGLISYCRRFRNQNRHVYLALTEWDQNELSTNGNLTSLSDNFEQHLSFLETVDLLQSYTSHYRGIAQLGIQALKLQLQGLSITEIAALYHVPPSHVGAWITRSKAKLKKDPAFLSEIA